MNMKLMTAILATLLAGLYLSAPLWADDLMTYPKVGQSPEQQQIYAEKRNHYDRAYSVCLEARD